MISWFYYGVTGACEKRLVIISNYEFSALPANFLQERKCHNETYFIELWQVNEKASIESANVLDQVTPNQGRKDEYGPLSYFLAFKKGMGN